MIMHFKEVQVSLKNECSLYEKDYLRGSTPALPECEYTDQNFKHHEQGWSISDIHTHWEFLEHWHHTGWVIEDKVEFGS